jgi:hypothetical protein
MLDLSVPKVPFDIALPYGLSVTVRPLTTAGMAAAQAAARRAVEAIDRQARERMEAALPLGGLPDLSAEGERDGFYQAQLIRELAVRHIASWTGVELEGGPAPPTPENIAAVMELYPVGERFFQEFTLRQVLLNAAKNGGGPLPLALPARRRARILQSLPRRRPALRPRRARSRRTALPLPRARLDQPSGAPSLGCASRLPSQLRRAPSGQVIGIDMQAALQLAVARSYGLAVLSELLPAAEAGVVEALCQRGAT